MEAENARIPVPIPRLTFATRVSCFVQLWAFKAFFNLYTLFLRFRGDTDPAKRPTYTKVYPIRPMITNRVWIPKSYKPGDKLLPLLIDVHGAFDVMADCRKTTVIISAYKSSRRWLLHWISTAGRQ